jgi:hypothetical protein
MLAKIFIAIAANFLTRSSIVLADGNLQTTETQQESDSALIATAEKTR